MEWYWIVCIVFCYVLFGAIIGEIWDAIAGCDNTFKTCSLFIWPLLITAILIAYSLCLIQKLGEFLVNLIMIKTIYMRRPKRRQKKAQKASCPENKKGHSREEIDDIDYDRRKR